MRPSPSPKLTMLLGTYNRCDDLKTCLETLIGRTACPHEVVVVDGGSTDGTRAYLKSLKGIRAIFQERLFGQAASFNRVLNAIQTDYICWLSDDNFLQPGAIDNSVSILEDHPDIGMVALKVRDLRGPLSLEPYIGSIWFSNVLNCNQGMLRTSLLKRIGGFSEAFMDYGMDAHLTTEVLLNGFKVVYTRAVAIHHNRNDSDASWADARAREDKIERARVLYQSRYGGLLQMRPPAERQLRELAGRIALDLIRLSYRLGDRAGLSLQQMTGYGYKDWYNAIQCPFISALDLVRSRRETFYLVQQMPEHVRNHQRIMPAAIE